MKRFRFNLQSVHDVREQEREQAERQLAQASSEVARAATNADEATGNKARALEEFAARLRPGDLDASEAALRASYLLTLDQRETLARREVSAREHERERCRRVAIETTRAAEATAKLRERQQSRHRADALRAEQNDLDELATLAAARRCNGDL